jgi:hypothetical protein
MSSVRNVAANEGSHDDRTAFELHVKDRMMKRFNQGRRSRLVRQNNRTFVQIGSNLEWLVCRKSNGRFESVVEL